MTLSLTGWRVLVTRPAHQADALCDLLQAQGAEPIRFPTLSIEPPSDAGRAKAQAQLARLADFDLAVFVSPNAIAQALRWIAPPLPATLKYAVVGKASARALEQAGYPVDFQPTVGSDSEALLALPGLQQVAGWRVLIVRGEGGRELLADTLRQRGAKVEYAEVYRRGLPSVDVAAVSQRWQNEGVHAVTITSNQTLEHLYALLDPAGQACLRQTPLVAVSPRAEVLARQLGHTARVQIAAEASDYAVLRALHQLKAERWTEVLVDEPQGTGKIIG